MFFWPFRTPHGPSSSLGTYNGNSYTIVHDRSRGPTESRVPCPQTSLLVREEFPVDRYPLGDPSLPLPAGPSRIEIAASSTTTEFDYLLPPLFILIVTSSSSGTVGPVVVNAFRSKPEDAGPSAPSNTTAESSHVEADAHRPAERSDSNRSHARLSHRPTRSTSCLPLTKTRSSARLLANTSPFDMPQVKNVHGKGSFTWYTSDQVTMVEPPKPGPNHSVRAGDLFLNTQHGQTRVWIRSVDNQSWISIQDGHIRFFGNTKKMLCIRAEKPAWISATTYKNNHSPKSKDLADTVAVGHNYGVTIISTCINGRMTVFTPFEWRLFELRVAKTRIRERKAETEFMWVKGHSGGDQPVTLENGVADKLAGEDSTKAEPDNRRSPR
ncbi:hypothetical protein B0H12DRAFT_1069900 [Mycena haematopus]|nr:hypothetical protein B0H12DRAFT_1069900 [Mycena haematopus]